MATKIIIIGFLLIILYTLGSSFYFLVKDKGKGNRMVNRLTWRIALSILLVLALVISLKMGWIQPQGVNPVQYPAQSSGTVE